MSDKPTGQAAMLAHGEGLADSVTTPGAILGSELRRYLHHLSASVLSFARQDGKEGTPRRVTDVAGQMMIPDQATKVQIFNRDGIKLTNEPERGLVVKVLALPPDLLMLPGQQDDGFAAAVAALPAPRDFALRGLQAACGSFQVARILNHFTGRERGEVLQAHVNSNLIAGLQDESALVLLDYKDDIPAISFAPDRAGLVVPSTGRLRRTRQLPIFERCNLSPVRRKPDCG